MNERIVIRCIKCGFAEERNIKDMIKLHLEPICSKCNNIMVVEDDEIFDNDLPNILEGKEGVINSRGEYITKEMLNDMILTDSLKREIAQNGNQLIYDCIEKITNPIHRLKYRKYFLLAGGFIPKHKIKLERN